MSLAEAVERMRGPVDTSIALTLRRPGRDEPIDVSMARAVITISPVRWHAEGDIGYIRVTAFNEQTETSLHNAIEQLKGQLGASFKGVVLDLRNNPGGLLEQAVAVADAFLDRGEIVSTRGRRPDSIQRFNARRGDEIDGRPMVVLINGGSASASEIVAGALQDHGRAIVMGTRSFGKGSVQTIMPLPGHGAIRLTTARYYTPAGTSIQAKGIVPDIEVQQSHVEVIDEGVSRREADLRGRLENEQVDGQDAVSGQRRATRRRSRQRAAAGRPRTISSRGRSTCCVAWPCSGHAISSSRRRRRPSDGAPASRRRSRGRGDAGLAGRGRLPRPALVALRGSRSSAGRGRCPVAGWRGSGRFHRRAAAAVAAAGRAGGCPAVAARGDAAPSAPAARPAGACRPWSRTGRSGRCRGSHPTAGARSSPMPGRSISTTSDPGSPCWSWGWACRPI